MCMTYELENPKSYGSYIEMVVNHCDTQNG